jgi:hypothetical protein
MNRLAAVTVAGLFTLPLFAAEPLVPGYKENDRVQLFFREILVAGPGVDQPRESHYLACTYSPRPVIMIFARELSEPVARLVKKVDGATAKHEKERLGSYMVLLYETVSRIDELKLLAKKEKVEHMHLAVAAPNEKFAARFPKEAEVTVALATMNRVKAGYAFRKYELTDKAIDQILADVPKILPTKN